MLHPALQKKDYVCDLPFCTVLFEDNKNYPWIFLVPKKDSVKSMRDLTHEERLTLMSEIERAENVMANLFNPTQTNVAMIGNMTPQLHVHIICRFEGDKAWPGTVWSEKAEPYPEQEKKEIIEKIKTALKGE
ncbi:MAG: HIT family protein [Alphaproteobacteria bacterium]|nr:HIT family protein [Alphaproteobacteria bacterium]